MTITTLTRIRDGASSSPLAIVPLEEAGPITQVYNTTSTTELTVGTSGSRTFTVASEYLAYQPGVRVRATSTSTGEWMAGTVTAYTGDQLTIVVDQALGTGTHTDWQIRVSGVFPVPHLFPGSVISAILTESHATNAATFTVKHLFTRDTPNPQNDVRVRLVTGDVRSIRTQLSLTIPAAATLGTVSGQAFRLWFLLVDDGGTMRLAVAQMRNGTAITSMPHDLVTTVTPPANTAGTFYSNVALTGKQFVILGYADYDTGLVTAGTWNASPTRINLYRPGDTLPGDIIQSTSNHSGAYISTITELMTIDNNPPPITEGTSIISHSITQKSASSVLGIDSCTMNTGATNGGVVALFQSSPSVTNALAASWVWPDYTLTESRKVAVDRFTGTAGTKTFQHRMGPVDTGSGYAVNGFGGGGGRVFGGVANSWIRIVEKIT